SSRLEHTDGPPARMWRLSENKYGYPSIKRLLRSAGAGAANSSRARKVRGRRRQGLESRRRAEDDYRERLAKRVVWLRSGAPGGAWTVSKTKFKAGRPIVVSH